MYDVNDLPTEPGIYDTRANYWENIDYNPYELDANGVWSEFSEEDDYRMFHETENMVFWLPLVKREG